MYKIKTGSLLNLWTQKEQNLGRRITLTEISEATEVSPHTIRKLLNNDTTRFDAHVLIALCEFFGVPSGTPVPFLVYYDDEEDAGAE